MKQLFRFLFTLCLLTTALTAAADTPASRFTLPGRTADEVTLSQYQGKVIYLDFWASWCGPCRQSFPWMSTMQQRYGKDGLVVIAVNVDKERAQADSFIAEHLPQFTIAFDPKGKVAEQYGVQVMPSSYLIDRQGHIVARHLGFHTAKADAMEGEITALLQQH